MDTDQISAVIKDTFSEKIGGCEHGSTDDGGGKQAEYNQ